MKTLELTLIVPLCSLFLFGAFDNSSGQTVVFTNRFADGRRLEVVRESAPFSLSESDARTWTNSGTGKVIRKWQTSPLPDGTDTFFAVMHDKNTTRSFRKRALELAHRPGQSDIAFVDVLIEQDVTIYLYREPIMPVENHEPSLVVQIVPNPGTVTGGSEMGFVLWMPRDFRSGFDGSGSKLISSRIAGSYARNTLAIEMSIVKGDYVNSRTNRFVNGKWIISKGEITPLRD